jgi:polysaccharide export outer membrane protein
MKRCELRERTNRLVLLGTLLVAVVCVLPCRAQNPATGETTGKGLQPNPLAALRAFEPPVGEEYQLGRGDELSLDFGVRTELNTKRIVGPDGRITLPLAGSVMVADKTREEASAAILAALEPYYNNLSVTVGVEKYTSNRVLLLGAVEHPGIITFDTPPTLLEVVSRGGVLGGVNTLEKMPVIPEKCAIYRGSDKVMWVDLKALLDSGSPLADIRLRRDDVVYVPSAADHYVSVLGQVQRPGAFQLESTTTLRKLLAEAGGLTDAAGANPGIRVISPSTGTTRIIPLKTLLQPGPLDLTLKSGDIVFVPKSAFNNISYVFDKVSPLISVFTAFALLEQ